MALSDQQTLTLFKCEQCDAKIAEEAEACPECGSDTVVPYEMPNPFSRLPMEDILRVTAHFVWMVGVVACLVLFWNTDNADDAVNYTIFLSGCGVLAFSLIISISLFGISEALRRLIRVQRRLRAFSEEYEKRQRRRERDKQDGGASHVHATPSG